ncbi:type VI secretion system contractile sheath small subunit [Pseudomonas mucidolens]|uniref:type VI secretion system contractile sheath small subunit n=1 Tax=Pseudomonas mucidolens TaxID=46679 RepID=UPI000ABE5AFC|nr:type VI secretion system contractile sheath small subunit [Pseudomonas mucidolens]SQH33581.1 type VI secretion protein [Pseudomonas mucidolens]
MSDKQSRVSAFPATLCGERVNVGYIQVPSLNRLMELRDALVALKGPLANDPQLRENVQKLLINAENHERVLGKVSVPAGPRTPVGE